MAKQRTFFRAITITHGIICPKKLKTTKRVERNHPQDHDS